MVNLDTRLINSLTGDELAVFCHILKRIGKENDSWPSRALLEKETGYGRKKIAKTIKGLTDKSIISHQQKKEDGFFSKTVYTVLTNLAGVYINASGNDLEISRDTPERTTVEAHAEKEPLSINHNISINQYKEIIDYLNSVTGKKFRGCKKSTQYFNQRIKEFKIDEIKQAIENASKDSYLTINSYLTPEYILRADKLDKWLNTKKVSLKDRYNSHCLSNSKNTEIAKYKTFLKRKKDALLKFDDIITIEEFSKLRMNGSTDNILITFLNYGKTKEEFLINLDSHVQKYNI